MNKYKNEKKYKKYFNSINGKEKNHKYPKWFYGKDIKKFIKNIFLP